MRFTWSHFIVLIATFVTGTSHAQTDVRVDQNDTVKTSLQRSLEILSSNSKQTQSQISKDEYALEMQVTYNNRVSQTYSKVLLNGHVLKISIHEDGLDQAPVMTMYSAGKRVYIEDDETTKVYSQYEQPYSASEVLIKRIRPAFYSKELESKIIKLEKETKTHFVFRTKIPDDYKAHLIYMQELYNSPPQKDKPYAIARLKTCNDLLKHGIPLTIHKSTGIITQYQEENYDVQIKNITQTQRVGINVVPKVAAQNDLSQRTTTHDFITIHADMYPPRPDKPGLIAMMLNTKTGQTFRAPFPGDIVQKAIFSNDRLWIYTIGRIDKKNHLFATHTRSQEIVPFKVSGMDLKHMSTISISTDDNLLLVNGLTPSPEFSDVAAVINIQEKTQSLIPLPANSELTEFHPDGSHFIGTQYNRKAKTSHMFLSDAKGKIQMTIPGSKPTLIKDNKAILFHRDWVWYTCDLSFENIKPFHPDKLKPARNVLLSVDEKFFYYTKSATMINDEPHLFMYEMNLETGKERKIDIGYYFQIPLRN